MRKKISTATKRFIRTMIISFISNFLIGFNIAFVDYIKSDVVNYKIMVATIIIAPIISGVIAALDKWLRYEEEEKYVRNYVNNNQRVRTEICNDESKLHGDLK